MADTTPGLADLLNLLSSSNPIGASGMVRFGEAAQVPSRATDGAACIDRGRTGIASGPEGPWGEAGLELLGQVERVSSSQKPGWSGRGWVATLMQPVRRSAVPRGIGGRWI